MNDAGSLTLADAARMMREATKNDTYRTTPLGPVVDKYMRWKRSEWGAAASTIKAIRYVLVALALDHADLQLSDFEPPVGTERVREFWDKHWGHLAARTRANRHAILSDFFKWACREQLLYGNPMLAISRPKQTQSIRPLFSQHFVRRVIRAQSYLADALACRLILIYGLRKAELTGLQFKHFDFDRRIISVLGKGSKVRQVPIVDDAFWLQLEELRLEIQGQPDDFLLYRLDVRRVLCSDWEADEHLDVGAGDIRYYRKRTLKNHREQLSSSSVHRWWYACLERSGEVPEGVTRGQNMHRGRHTAITDLLRTPGVNLKHAQLLAGHASIQTTADIYGQFDTDDVAHALRLRDAIHEEDDPAR